jgi:hypothetical protein
MITVSLNSSLRHGKLTEAQVKNTIGDPKELQAQVRHELRALLASQSDGFEPAARAALEAALKVPEKTFDPSLARLSAFQRIDNTGVQFTEIPGGQLFVGGISPSDVAQGRLGDCFFLATLAGFAQTKPEVLREAIVDNGNGTFTARFFEVDSVYGHQPVYVTVDSDIPTLNGLPMYAQTPYGELWPAMLEKAYAKFRGSYGSIGNGGLPGEVVFALTGEAPSTRLVALTSAKRTFERVNEALGKGKPVMVATLSDSLKPRSMPVAGIVPGHVYTVMRAFEQDGEKFIEVRNPWGVQPEVVTPRGVIASSNGTFALTRDEFKAAFPVAFISD